MSDHYDLGVGVSIQKGTRRAVLAVTLWILTCILTVSVALSYLWPSAMDVYNVTIGGDGNDRAHRISLHIISWELHVNLQLSQNQKFNLKKGNMCPL